LAGPRIVQAMSTRPPYGSYAAIASTFVGGLTAASLVGRALGRDPQCQKALDLVVLVAATFKASRTLAHDEVTSFIRQPFVKGVAHSGEGEEPVEGGVDQALGELVTCTRCVGTWAAACLATTQILAPRFGRVFTWSLAAAGLNDLLQAGFVALTEKASQLEEQMS
jgi:hypothetical protein